MIGSNNGPLASGALARVVANLDSEARIGLDVVDVAELGKCVEAAENRFLERIYTNQELDFCDGRIERLATRFAAKEAVLKLLGTGMRGVDARDIEVVSLETGEPTIRLIGDAQLAAGELGLTSIRLSLCHESGLAFAVAVGGKCKGESHE